MRSFGQTGCLVITPAVYGRTTLDLLSLISRLKLGFVSKLGEYIGVQCDHLNELLLVHTVGWMLDAASRPNFRELANEFEKYAKDPGRYLVIEVGLFAGKRSCFVDLCRLS